MGFPGELRVRFGRLRRLSFEHGLGGRFGAFRWFSLWIKGRGEGGGR